MNGETQIILDRLMKIETQQEERHRENIHRMKKLDRLPCAERARDIKYLGIGVKVLYGVVLAVLLIWVRIALAQ